MPLFCSTVVGQRRSFSADRYLRRLSILAGATLLAACGTAGQSDQTRAFADIAPAETIRALGTEPFWNATVAGDRLTYATPDDPEGRTTAVSRFAGNSGLAFHGELGGQPVDLVVTQGACSDGMSDRRFPYTVTLQIGDEQREGCAYTDRQPFSGPAAP